MCCLTRMSKENTQSEMTPQIESTNENTLRQGGKKNTLRQGGRKSPGRKSNGRKSNGRKSPGLQPQPMTLQPSGLHPLVLPQTRPEVIQVRYGDSTDLLQMFWLVNKRIYTTRQLEMVVKKHPTLAKIKRVFPTAGTDWIILGEHCIIEEYTTGKTQKFVSVDFHLHEASVEDDKLAGGFFKADW